MGGNHEKARASDVLVVSQQCETSVSLNWKGKRLCDRGVC